MIRRPRRLRVTKQIRDLVHETSIDKTDLIYPMFIIDGETEDIPSIAEDQAILAYRPAIRT